MARTPKPLRGKEFQQWYDERMARCAEHADSDHDHWFALYFMRNRHRAGKLYKAHLDYRRLLDRYTEAGWRGYSADGQWLRRESKRRQVKWKNR